MKIKMIAVDMDGTFLDDSSNYNRERFLGIYQQMKAEGIHFVVASGNPHIQLKNSFGDEGDELIYIAENGALIIEQNTEIFKASLSGENRASITQALKQHEDVLCWVCTKGQSYALESMPQEYFERFLPYFPGVKKVADYDDIKEDILKFALYLPNGNVEERIRDFESVVKEDVSVIDSGHDCVDIVSKNANKGYAIELLMERYGIKKDEVMAFGNAMNDAMMLEKAGVGYAMENSNEAFKAMFEYIAPSNNEEGVLKVIEDYLNNRKE